MWVVTSAGCAWAVQGQAQAKVTRQAHRTLLKGTLHSTLAAALYYTYRSTVRSTAQPDSNAHTPRTHSHR
jgi:hypothetical protein